MIKADIARNSMLFPKVLLRIFALTLLLLSTVIVFTPQPAHACCFSCADSDCDQATDFISQAHDDLRQNTQDEFDDDLDAFEDWLIDIMLHTEFVPAMADMATQMAATAMFYNQMVGSFLDAQLQMDTQRVLRKLQFEAHKDYHPSETFCYFGTNVRSLAATETKGEYNALALSQISLARQLGNMNQAGSARVVDDYEARWKHFVVTHCDPLDDNFQDYATGAAFPMTGLPPGAPRTGLLLACDRDASGSGNDIGAVNRNRFNRDISYTRLIEKPRTLNLDFSNATLDVTVQPIAPLYTGPILQPGEEEDVIALSKNLYGSRVLSRSLSKTILKSDNAHKLYLVLRSVAAKRSVAQASFNAVVALKSSGTTETMTGGSAKPTVDPVVTPVVLDTKQTRRFMGAIIAQLLPADPAISAGNIFDLIGYSPSYYSQLEILAKRLYQNPDFYAQLYDSPANVVRKKVAMQAIELMVDREIYESQVRREMSISVLLASKLRATHRDANRDISAAAGR